MICMLAAILALATGCGSEKEVLEYDEAQITGFTDWLISFYADIDEEHAESLRSLRTFSFEQQLTELGLPISPEVFISAMDSWQMGEEECGEFIGHGEYTFEAGEKELKVTTEAEFENRNAEIEFVFDKNLFLDNLTVSAHFSLGEILEKAALNTLLGMGTVFLVLILISLIISLFKYIPDIQEEFRNRRVKAQTAAMAAIPAAPGEEPPQVLQLVPLADDPELIAVIAAAIAAAEGTTTDGFIVRSIKKRKVTKRG